MANRPRVRWPASEDLRDEGALADYVSGMMWAAAGVVALVGVALPGSDRRHLVWIAVLTTFAVAWGIASFAFARGTPLTVGMRAAITAVMMPVVAFALWATGGGSSQVRPLLICSVLFIAYFFPPRLAWPLAAMLCVAYASPLLYDPRAVDEGYPAQSLTFVAAVAAVTLVMRMLKGRLLGAEAEQRAMAERDALTGLRNRRSFDAALERATRDVTRPRTALVLFDFDGFKAINDAFGHPTGDAVLCAVADACRTAVRQEDCLARIGGDEFGVVAHGAGADAAERIEAALADAIAGASMPAGVEPVTATFGVAIAPADGIDPPELVRRADEQLLARKRASRLAPES
ncbi:MAG TPA: GGDEF domain-containing protein [Longimicrobium sp.]|nr:GGDEF domain-containing protein [Longimicrobium sp.]